MFLLLKQGFWIDVLRYCGLRGEHSWPFNETLQRLKYMKSRGDKAMDILIGSSTNDIVCYWVRDKAWTCKLTEGPLLPLPLLANSLHPSVVSSVSRAGLNSPGSSMRAAIRHLSDSHPQQSSLKGKPVVYILRDTGLPLPLFFAVTVSQILRLFNAIGMEWEFYVISSKYNHIKMYFKQTIPAHNV